MRFFRSLGNNPQIRHNLNQNLANYLIRIYN